MIYSSIISVVSILQMSKCKNGRSKNLGNIYILRQHKREREAQNLKNDYAQKKQYLEKMYGWVGV